MKQQTEPLLPLFNAAVEFIKDKETISCAEIQLHFKLGYNYAGRLVDQLEDEGYLSPFEGSRQRKVLTPLK